MPPRQAALALLPAADLRRGLEAAAGPESQRAAGPEQDSELALPRLSLARAVRPALPA